MAVGCSHVILVKFGAGYVIILQYIVTAVAQLFPGLPCNLIFVHILCCLYIKESFISVISPVMIFQVIHPYCLLIPVICMFLII